MILNSFCYIISTIFTVVKLWTIEQYFEITFTNGVFWTATHLIFVYGIVHMGSTAKAEVILAFK